MRCASLRCADVKMMVLLSVVQHPSHRRRPSSDGFSQVYPHRNHMAMAWMEARARWQQRDFQHQHHHQQQRHQQPDAAKCELV